MSQTIDGVYRDFKTAGVPTSGEHEPRKPEIRALLKQIQNSGGMSVTRNTKAALEGITPPNENYMGVVLTGQGAGYYSRVGGAWVFGRGFSDTLARLEIVGGTPNAIVAEAATGVAPGDVGTFIIDIIEANTAAVTISINGGPYIPVLSVDGDDYEPGEFTGRLMLENLDTELLALTADPAVIAALVEEATSVAPGTWQLLRDETVDARDLTVAARDVAVPAAAIALAQADRSASASEEAKLARDAALSGGVIYPDIATGRAASAAITGPDAYFKVLGSDAVSFVLYKRLSSATQEIVMDQASAAGMNAARRPMLQWTDATYSIVDNQYFNYATGAAVTGQAGLRTAEVAVAGGETMRVTSRVGTNANHAKVVFLGVGDVYLGFIDRGAAGIVDYTKSEFEVPKAARKALFSGLTAGSITVEIASISTNELAQDSLKKGRRAASAVSRWSSPTSVIESGYYYNRTTGAKVASASFRILTAPCEGGERARCTVTVSGSITAMVVFLDAHGVAIGRLNVGADGVDAPYVDYEFDIPTNARSIGLTGKAANAISLQFFSIVSGLLGILDQALANTADIPAVTNSLKSWQAVDGVVQAGKYLKWVNGYEQSLAGYQYLKVPVVGGEKMRCTVTVSGVDLGKVLFFDAGNIRIGGIDQGSNGVATPYVNSEFNVPAEARYVGISGTTAVALKLEIYKVDEALSATVATQKARIDAIEPQVSYWKGKTAVWFGTSIPAGGSTKYPSMVAALLGIAITNEAVGSSMARNGVATSITGSDPYGWTGLPWQNVAYSFSMSPAEKDEVITNWEPKWYDLLGGTGKPAKAPLDAPTQAFWRDCSYAKRLVERHLGANRKDLYIFDHGHNDNIGTDIVTMPGSNRNRGYFLGAMNFLIDLILADNPKAKIIIIGHYENARKANVSLAQTTLAEFWDYPFIKLWERLGWSQQQVTSTGYWSNGLGSNGVWVPSGGASAPYTMTQIWMPDDLHPHSDLNGGANMRIAEVIAGQMMTIR